MKGVIVRHSMNPMNPMNLFQGLAGVKKYFYVWGAVLGEKRFIHVHRYIYCVFLAVFYQKTDVYILFG